MDLIDRSPLQDFQKTISAAHRAENRAPAATRRFLSKTLLDRSPRFFVLVNGFPIDEGMMRQPDFARGYRRVRERNHRLNWTPPGSYTLHVYERRGLRTRPHAVLGQAPRFR